MALQGKLTILGGRTYGIVECSYSFSQTTDETGKPTSRTKGGTITFTMPSTSDEDTFFYHWMFNKTEVQSGRLKFTVFTSDNRKSYKTIEFTNAYCTELKDYFNNNDSKLMYTTVTISAEIIIVGTLLDQAVFSNEWT
jgi:hypothetical protein